MREILFRGKRINNGEWVYGYYVPVCFGKFPCKQAIVPEPDGVWEPIAVKPETVDQFTGLTDKNGKKIFEGDIVKVENNDHDWYEHDPNSYSVFAVDFDEGGYTVGSYFLQNWLWFDEFHGEVIGNIHDNPELLEE